MPYRKNKGWWLQKPVDGIPLDVGHHLYNGLAAFYMFNEGAGNVVYDNVTGRYNGVIQKLNTSTNTYWTPTPNGIGLGHKASSTVNGIALPSGLSTTTTFTFEVLFRSDASANGTYYNLFGQGKSFGFWLKGVNAGLNLRVSLLYTNATDHFNNSFLTAGNWYHYVCSVNGGNASFYINGVADGTSINCTNLNLNGMLCDNIANGGEQFVGSVLYERLWIGRALTATEVREVYQNPYGMVPSPQRRIISGALSLLYGGQVMGDIFGGSILKPPTFGSTILKSELDE